LTIASVICRVQHFSPLSLPLFLSCLRAFSFSRASLSVVVRFVCVCVCVCVCIARRCVCCRVRVFPPVGAFVRLIRCLHGNVPCVCLCVWCRCLWAIGSAPGGGAGSPGPAGTEGTKGGFGSQGEKRRLL
jgi:hypothetical protein